MSNLSHISDQLQCFLLRLRIQEDTVPLELTPEFSILRLEMPFIFKGTMNTEIPFAPLGPVLAATKP